MAKRETTFQPPHISPAVAGNPAAAKYAQKVQQKYAAPIGGGANPPIPRLDQPTQGGLTMADHARQQGFTVPEQSGELFQPTMHRTAPQAPPPVGILPTDILPEAAKQDPNFQQGMGSMFAVSQPLLAQKYGVIRNNQLLAPQQLGMAKPGLSKSTLEGIQALSNTQATVDAREAQQRAEAEASVSAAASQAGKLGSSDTKPLSAEDKEKLQRTIDKMDDFDFNTFREMMMKDLLNNEDQRAAIEARLDPLDITDLIINGRVCQKVPIVPGKFEPEFQSISGEEDLAIKRLVWQEQKSLDAPNQYMLDKYSLMGVALSIRSINNQLLPAHQDAQGHFSDESFMAKYNRVIRLPFHMLSSLGINFFWFDVRVRRLFQTETIKNG